MANRLYHSGVLSSWPPDGTEGPPPASAGWPAGWSPGIPQAGWPPTLPVPPAAGPLHDRPRRRRRRWAAMTVTAIIGIICLMGAVVAATKVHRDLARKPTAAELTRAAAKEAARRWQAWPLGKIFPAKLPFTADLEVSERATRVGLDHPRDCSAAVDQRLAPVLSRYGCRGVVRATYLDQRQAVVFTIGLMAFPSEHAAALARSRIEKMPPGRGSGLRALAIPKTASAWFSNGARQAATMTAGGTYLVLTTAGYADGRPAAKTIERRPAVFEPARQLAQAVLMPLTAPAVPRCGTPGWTC